MECLYKGYGMKCFSEEEMEAFERRFEKGAILIWKRPDGSLGNIYVNPGRTAMLDGLAVHLSEAMMEYLEKHNEGDVCGIS